MLPCETCGEFLMKHMERVILCAVHYLRSALLFPSTAGPAMACSEQRLPCRNSRFRIIVGLLGITAGTTGSIPEDAYFRRVADRSIAFLEACSFPTF